MKRRALRNGASKRGEAPLPNLLPLSSEGEGDKEDEGRQRLKQDDGELLRLSLVEPGDRVLLLSHCLRPSDGCPGKFNKKGLQCLEDCRLECAIHRLKQAAALMGYAGVCIAAGGAMAVRFVKEYHPGGIVAVACRKELDEGVAAIKEMVEKGGKLTAIATIPLLTDGCVDTQVDEAAVLRVINLAPVQAVRKG